MMLDQYETDQFKVGPLATASLSDCAWLLHRHANIVTLRFARHPVHSIACVTLDLTRAQHFGHSIAQHCMRDP